MSLLCMIKIIVAMGLLVIEVSNLGPVSPSETVAPYQELAGEQP